ncbi:hypothetical protein AN958_11109 [Leucoagaricus sp. SymC.cos]|nr:hypothetical protein AN958_11109 [Leucoagaricus sp. SymC.cos]
MSRSSSPDEEIAYLKHRLNAAETHVRRHLKQAKKRKLCVLFRSFFSALWLRIPIAYDVLRTIQGQGHPIRRLVTCYESLLTPLGEADRRGPPERLDNPKDDLLTQEELTARART